MTSRLFSMNKILISFVTFRSPVTSKKVKNIIAVIVPTVKIYFNGGIQTELRVSNVISVASGTAPNANSHIKVILADNGKMQLMINP